MEEEDELDDALFLLLEEVSPEEALSIWESLNGDGTVTEEELEKALEDAKD